ncbi:MAG: hypothetical protein IPF51_14615 [Dehalococcoidia bacterium]|uniref:hypothetical protein n=1 Tax=Candidatus Amarobacter glycogenicus TaxID=3140699 RepID=UPI003136FD12|nr:hypothetical protein [Dehalococcoidia bacterium]
MKAGTNDRSAPGLQPGTPPLAQSGVFNRGSCRVRRRLGGIRGSAAGHRGESRSRTAGGRDARPTKPYLYRHRHCNTHRNDRSSHTDANGYCGGDPDEHRRAALAPCHSDTGRHPNSGAGAAHADARASDTRASDAGGCIAIRRTAEANSLGNADPEEVARVVMSWKLSGIVAVGVVLGIVLGRIAQDPDTGTASWDGLRAAGFAGYLCLWFGLCSGIAVHMRYRPGPMALTWLLEAHRMSSALSLSFVAGHIAGLLVDPTVPFSVLDVSLGLTGGYRPVQVAFGAFAMWMTVAVLSSTALSFRLPYATWRNLHFLSFPAYALALLHGITAGTDASSTAALAIYASTASVVAALVVTRLLGRGWVSAATESGSSRPTP